MRQIPVRARLLAPSLITILVAACGGGGGSSKKPAPPPVDTTPPDTTLAGAPTAVTNNPAVTFTFSSTEAGSTFESRLDGAAFAATTSPQTLTALRDGSHTFDVRAKDAAGNVDATPASATWVVDTTPPDTQISQAPPVLTNSTSANVTATTADNTATLEYSLDNAAYVTATFPLALAGLGNGTHVINVRARDAAGNVDATPASATWVVDLVAPDTSFSPAPVALTNSTSATINVTATEPATFEFSLDGAAYTVQVPPVTYNGLAAGSHTLNVRARDTAGNVDATPAAATWIVDLTPPTGAIQFPTPISYTDASTLTIRGTASDANGVQGVTVNGVAAVSATGFNTWRATVPITNGATFPVATGANAITVSVTDRAGNTNSSAAAVTVYNRGPMLLQSAGADYDRSTNSVYVTDSEKNSLFAYNASTGIGRLITDFTLSMSTTAIADVVVDTPNNRALVLDWAQDAIYSVDLVSGARSTLSQGTSSGTTSLSLGFGLAYDAAGNRAFVTVRGSSSNSVIAVNLTTGARTVVSSLTVGTGTAFGNPLGIAYDAGSARLLVADASSTTPGIYQVDIATGNRVMLSASPGTGTGPAMPAPTSLKLDAPDNRLYVVDTSGGTLLSIDLATGNRTLVAGPSTGTGAAFNPGVGLAMNAVNGHLFTTSRTGEVLEIAPSTLARDIVLDGRVGSGLRIEHPQAVRAEQASGAVTSLLFGEPDAQRLMRLDIATSTRSTVSGSGVGGGPALGRMVDFVLDTRAPANGSAVFGLLSSPGNSLVSIDVASGNRTTLASLLANVSPRNLQLDAGGNRILYTNLDFGGATHGLYSIQLPGLTQSAISSGAVGSGTAFTGPTTFVLDPAGSPTRALLVDLNPTRWLQVDLATGARSTFTTTSGLPALPLLGPLHYDTANSQVYGLNLYPQHLFVSTVTPGGGESGRDMISGAVPGSFGVIGTGPLVDFGTGLYVDTTRNVAFAADSTSASIMAIDLASGDRVVIAR